MAGGIERRLVINTVRGILRIIFVSYLPVVDRFLIKFEFHLW